MPPVCAVLLLNTIVFFFLTATNEMKVVCNDRDAYFHLITWVKRPEKHLKASGSRVNPLITLTQVNWAQVRAVVSYPPGCALLTQAESCVWLPKVP